MNLPHVPVAPIKPEASSPKDKLPKGEKRQSFLKRDVHPRLVRRKFYQPGLRQDHLC